VIERLSAEAEQAGEEDSARLWPVPHSEARQGRSAVHRMLRGAAVVALTFGPLAGLFGAGILIAGVGMKLQIVWLQVFACVLFAPGLYLLHYVFSEECIPVNQANRLARLAVP
jgi:hypothetical protein